MRRSREKPVGVPPIVLLDRLFPLAPIKGVQVENIGFSIAGYEVKAAGNAYTFLVEIDCKDLVRYIVRAAGRLLLHREQVRLGQTQIIYDLPPNMKHSVDSKSGRSAGRVDGGLMLCGLSIFTHMSMTQTRREVLPLFALCRLIDEVLERVIDDVQIRVKKFPILKRADADLKVIRR